MYYRLLNNIITGYFNIATNIKYYYYYAFINRKYFPSKFLRLYIEVLLIIILVPIAAEPKVIYLLALVNKGFITQEDINIAAYTARSVIYTTLTQERAIISAAYFNIEEEESENNIEDYSK